MKRNFTLVFSLLVLLATISVQATTSISGYFDMEITKKKDAAPTYRQHHMNLMMQHETDIYKMFSEIEFEDAVDLQKSWADSRGRLFVERAWGEAAFSKYFNLRMGQMLHGSLFYQNHYPSIAVYTGKQFTRKSVFNRNVTGIRAYGELGFGVGYQLWNGKDNSSTSGEGNGAKLSWNGQMGDISMMFAAQMAKYNQLSAPSHDALGFEASVDMNGLALWFEYGTREEKGSKHNTASNDSAKGTAMDILLSYSMDMGEKGEIVPFFMYSHFKGSGLQSGKLTVGKYWDKKSEITLGLNYRPIPTITWKAQFKSIPVATEKDGASSTKDTVSSNEIGLAFVYFYN